ncbi:hypothetical protein [Halobacteriovorax sp. HLS]|uniref:hypothetical protein n=1 Tax=Halobacteriovorax sp. HLS TaxID=2234000 RepID=UPI000FD9598E|nr:hypothetical protein [Halobacteriovorax sp. HLS]
MQIKFGLIVAILISSSQAKETCSAGKIKFINNQKEKIEKLTFCTDSDKYGEFIYSKDCQGLSCNFLKDPYKRPANLSKYAKSVGSPGFKLCRELKGSPQIIQYQVNSDEWKQDSRCFFGKSSFVSINVLMTIWKDFIVY